MCWLMLKISIKRMIKFSLNYSVHIPIKLFRVVLTKVQELLNDEIFRVTDQISSNYNDINVVNGNKCKLRYLNLVRL